MPFKIIKVKNKPCYKVVNKKNGKIHAKCTTRAKAEAQIRVIYAADTKKK